MSLVQYCAQADSSQATGEDRRAKARHNAARSDCLKSFSGLYRAPGRMVALAKTTCLICLAATGHTHAFPLPLWTGAAHNCSK